MQSYTTTFLLHDLCLEVLTTGSEGINALILIKNSNSMYQKIQSFEANK